MRTKSESFTRTSLMNTCFRVFLQRLRILNRLPLQTSFFSHLSARSVLQALRWLVFVTVLFVVLFGYKFGHIYDALPALMIIALYGLANIVFAQSISRSLEGPSWTYKLFLADLSVIAVALFSLLGLDSDFYLICSLIVYFSVIVKNAQNALPIAALGSMLYSLMLSWRTPFETFFDGEILIRLPFFFILSLFTGYLSELEEAEHVHIKEALRREKTLRRINQQLEEAYQEVHQKSRELEALVKINRDIAALLDRDILLPRIAEEARRLLKTEGANFRLVEGEFLEHYKSLHGEVVAFRPRLRLGESLTGKIINENRVVVIKHVAEDPSIIEEHREMLRKRGFHAYLGVPLQIGGRAIGAINLYTEEEREFSKEDIDLISAFADQAAIAVENSRLYERIKKKAVELEKDITERKLAEAQLKVTNAELFRREKAFRETLSDLKESHEQLKAAQSQLIQAEKLESVGRLAAGVAHEVKNPLAIILQGINYLSKHLTTDGDNVVMALQDMDNAVKRADSVVRGLLDFSAANELSLNTEELNSVLEQSLLLVRHELARYHVNAVRELSERLPPVRLDRNKLEQVFVNIFLNAFHAMPEGGTLIIKTYAKQLTEIGHNGGSRKADHFRIGETVVMAEVEDTGTGIPEDQLAKIFDPFFTTKSTGKGTGLGLTVTKKIIELHAGTINIGNREEGGARVTIMFKP